MLQRIQSARIRRRLTDFPAVAILGPRQCGKTTLARSIAPDASYFDLEQPGDRARLDADWDRVAASEGVVILDEAQAHPPVFARLRGAIDADRRRAGRFLITGSVNPALSSQISESLAGRLAIVELAPLVWAEARADGSLQLDDLHVRGGFPDALLGPSPEARREWTAAYLRLVFERDLPALGVDLKPPLLRRLTTMLAHAQGGWWNASRLGGSLGVSHHTVQRYADLLEQTYLLRVLAPWSANLGKRLRKKPRVYLRDSGLVHALLGLGSREDVMGHPVVGATWEGFVIEELLRREDAVVSGATPWCFATSDGYEADLVLERGGTLLPIEIKLTARPDQRDIGRFIKVIEMLGAPRGLLICRAAEGWTAGPLEVVPVERLLRSPPSSILDP